MPPAKLLIGGAAATAALGVRVARTLYGRWRVMPERERAKIEPMAEDLKRRALDMRGTSNPQQAGQELRAASETFAAALLETAEADPEMDAEEVRELRDELRRELERLASADIKASRSRPERSTPSG